VGGTSGGGAILATRVACRSDSTPNDATLVAHTSAAVTRGSFASCISRSPQNDSLTEPRLAELIQEGHAFLGPGHSGKPLCFGEVIWFGYSFL